MAQKKYQLQEIEVWDGNLATAHALRQADIDVVAAYPITPSTPIIQNYGNFNANGYVESVFSMVESEHAAMSACVGAAAAGGRVATATSSQGFALMIEVLYQASGMRLPVVLCVANRALAAPLNVNGDHSDMYLGRDTGWVQLDAYNPQEAYDMTLMAFRIGEDHRVRLPVMVHQDGFVCSHTAQNVRPLSDEDAVNFVGEYKPKNAMLDFSKAVTHGAQTEEDWHFEHKARQHFDLFNAVPEVARETFNTFEKLTGRKYNFVDEYMCEDAEMVVFAMGTTVESAQVAAKQVRKQFGIKVGVVGLRLIRPFPYEQVKTSLSKFKAVAAMDRSSPNGALGMLFNEAAGALIGTENAPVLTNYIYGLGGRDLLIDHLVKVYKNLDANAKTGKATTPVQQFLGLRGKDMAFF